MQKLTDYSHRLCRHESNFPCFQTIFRKFLQMCQTLVRHVESADNTDRVILKVRLMEDSNLIDFSLKSLSWTKPVRWYSDNTLKKKQIFDLYTVLYMSVPTVVIIKNSTVKFQLNFNIFWHYWTSDLPVLNHLLWSQWSKSV